VIVQVRWQSRRDPSGAAVQPALLVSCLPIKRNAREANLYWFPVGSG